MIQQQRLCFVIQLQHCKNKMALVLPHFWNITPFLPILKKQRVPNSSDCNKPLILVLWLFCLMLLLKENLFNESSTLPWTLNFYRRCYYSLDSQGEIGHNWKETKECRENSHKAQPFMLGRHQPHRGVQMSGLLLQLQTETQPCYLWLMHSCL